MSGQTLGAALNRATPIHEGGNAMHGHTSWHVSWHFDWRHEANGSCAIASVHCDATAEVTLPELQSTDKDMSERFERYLAALKEHERGHVRIAESAAQQVDAAILALPAAADCASLERSANDAGQQILARSRSAEARYDQETRHGRTQGAWVR